MSVWSTIGKSLLICGLSSFYTFLMLLQTAFQLICKGKSYLNVKQRQTPPTCLTDGSLGKHNYVKLKEVKLHYVEAGDSSKPLVLFLHGYPEFWFSWRHQIKALKDDFRTVAVDLRGYGDSDKPSGIKSYATDKLVGDIEELIPALGHSKCFLVAHDWGGLLAWYLAMKSPHLIEKLIILNSPHPVAFTERIRSSLKQFRWSWYIFFFQMPIIPEFVSVLNDVQIFDKLFFSHPRGKEVFCQHDIEAYKYTFSKRSDFTGPINYYRSVVRHLLSKVEVEPPRITLPVLIIWGMDDSALTQELATMSSQYCDNCVVKFVKGASHWVQQDSAPIVNKHIIEFLVGKED